MLSPFHNPIIWRDVYLRADMRVIGRKDHRQALMDKMAGRHLALGKNRQLAERWPIPRHLVLRRYKKLLAKLPVSVERAVT